MKRSLLWTLAVAVLLTAPQVASAQKPDKQFVTVSFSGYDDLMNGVGMIGKLAGMPDLPKMLEAQLQQSPAAAALDTLDKSQPWVVTVKTDSEGNEFAVQACVPSKDVKKLIESVPMPGGASDAGDGVVEVKTPGGGLFAKQHGAWAVLSNDKRWVMDAPEDPVKALGGLNKKYHLAVNFSIKSIPEGLRTKFLGIMTFAMQAGMRQMPGESEEQYAARSKMVQQGLEQVKTAMADLDALTLGIKVDESSSSAYLDYIITVVPGSKTAEKMAKSIDVKTDFAGALLPGAAAALNVTQKLDPEDLQQVKSQMGMLRANALSELEKQGLSDDQLKQAKQLAGDLMDVLDKTLEAGKLDAAASLKLGPSVLTLVAGTRIADGGKLESTIKQLIQQVGKDEPEVAKFIKLDAEQHGGVRLHVLSVPTAGMDGGEKLAALVGQTMDVVVGISDDSLYLAAGRDAAKTLKQAIDASKAGAGKALPPMQLSLAAGAIAQFVAAIGDEDVKPGAEMVAKMLEGSAGKDHVKLTATQIPNGAQVRLEVEEGLLKLAGAIPAMAGGMMPGGPPAVKKVRPIR